MDRHRKRIKETGKEKILMEFIRWLLYKTQIGEFHFDKGNLYTPEEIYELFKEEKEFYNT